MTGPAVRLSYSEAAELAPLIAELLDMLDPLAGRMFKVTRAHGGTVRALVIPEVDVDVCRLARFIYARSGVTIEGVALEAAQ